MDVERLRDAVNDGSIDTVICAFPDLYGRLLGKRLDASFFLERLDAGLHACDYLFTVDMEMEPVGGYTFASWEKGYGDVHLVVDSSTLRTAAWLQATAIVLCDATTDDGPVTVAPRTILRRQVEGSGYDVVAATELEYYLYRTTYTEAAQSGYRDLPAAGWYLEDYHVLQGSAPRISTVRSAVRSYRAASPSRARKASGGRASTRSMCGMRPRSRWPTVTSS